MKKTVCTLTLNPALDLSGTVDLIKPNEKTYVHDEVRAPGGNSINCARILNRLEIPVRATGFLGGSTGLEIKALLDNEKVKNHFIKTTGTTRINVTVTNRSDHKQTRLSFSGPEISPEERRNLFNFVKKCRGVNILVIGGSLPPQFTTRHLSELILLAQKMKMEVIVDCPGEILSKIIFTKPLLIKPNLEEFHVMTETKVRSLKAVQKKAKEFLDKVPYICVSSVEGGTLLVGREGNYFGKIPSVKVISTVGAGDSMVAGMISQLQSGGVIPSEMLRWGLAAAAATLSEPGTTLGSASRIRQLYEKAVVRKI